MGHKTNQLMPRGLINILVCPFSKRPLRLLSDTKLNHLNQLIADDGLCFCNGQIVRQRFSQALISADNSVIYRVDNGVPLLLEAWAIDLRVQSVDTHVLIG